MGRRYLVTGGAGFIGSNFVRHVLAHEPEAQVTNLDLLTYAGVEATVRELDADPRHTFVRGDIGDAALEGPLGAPQPRGDGRRACRARRSGLPGIG